MSGEAAEFLKKLLGAGDSRPFDDLISEFNSKIKEPSSIFHCCDTINTVIDTKKLSPTERLVGFAILHQAYSSEQTSSNPFISVLVNAASNEKAEKFERAFILQLLGFNSSTNIAEVLNLSAADYIRNFNPSSHTFLPREQLQQQHCSKIGCDINSTELDLQPGVTTNIGSGARDENVSGLLLNFPLKGSGPQRVRPRLPAFPVLEGELEGLNLDNTHELMWDGGMCGTPVEPAKGSTVEDLIAKGLEGPLEPAEEEQVLLGLGDKALLPVENLRELVENNPNIAAAVLIKLKDSSEFKEYSTILFRMEMGFNLIEVVNQLNKAVKLQTGLVLPCMNHGLMFWKNIKDDNPQKAFDFLFKLAELPGFKEQFVRLVNSAMIKRPLATIWDSLKDGDAQVAFDFLLKFARINEVLDSDMIERPLADFWDKIKDGDPEIAFDFLFRLAEFPCVIKLVNSAMIERLLAAIWDSLKDGDAQVAFDFLFKFARINEVLDSAMIKRPLADFWDKIKDGDPEIAFDFLFRLAEFPCVIKQFVGLVNVSHMIDRLLEASGLTSEFIRRFIKSCIPPQPHSKAMSPQAIFLIGFFKKLIQEGIIEGECTCLKF